MDHNTSIKKIMVTGSGGFLGRNLCIALQRMDDVCLLRYDVENSKNDLHRFIQQADFIFHLAGVNRPADEREFEEVNADLTRDICALAEERWSRPPLMISSSTQAEMTNSYGLSKKAAEDIVIDYSRRTGAPVMIYRFPNLFGKWSRPNYNSVISTFCHNLTHDREIQVSDPERVVTFAYVDDVVYECLRRMRLIIHRGDEALIGRSSGGADIENVPETFYYSVRDTHSISLGDLAAKVRAFRAVREGALMPDLSDPFTRKLYATFMSYYDINNLAYPARMNIDNRGWLFELIKSEHFGQIFVSITHPGVTRGNHSHNTKAEKFCVIQGSGIIRLRHICTNEVASYSVSGENVRIVDIPPGCTHSIENTGGSEMITLFWASEVFNPERTDTYSDEVLKNETSKASSAGRGRATGAGGSHEEA